MGALNEPTGWAPESQDADWAPARGLGRGAAYGFVAAVILAGALVPAAKWVPLLLLDAYLRVAVAFMITWILAATVQRGAGMVGWPCTGLAVGYAGLVLLSNHVVFAVCGVLTRGGFIAGWVWLAPGTLLGTNLLALVGVGFAAALCHRGSDIGSTVVDLLMQNPLTGRR